MYKKIQNFLYKRWGWKEVSLIMLYVFLLVKISEYSEIIATGIYFFSIINLVILKIMIPKPID